MIDLGRLVAIISASICGKILSVMALACTNGVGTSVKVGGCHLIVIAAQGVIRLLGTIHVSLGVAWLIWEELTLSVTVVSSHATKVCSLLNLFLSKNARDSLLNQFNLPKIT